MMVAREITQHQVCDGIGHCYKEFDYVKKINILALDPVPGSDNQNGGPVAEFGNDFILSDLVNQYVGLYEEHETTYRFEPVIPVKESEENDTAIFIRRVPGGHETIVGNKQLDAHGASWGDDNSWGEYLPELQCSNGSYVDYVSKYDYVNKTARVIMERLLSSKEWGEVPIEKEEILLPYWIVFGDAAKEEVILPDLVEPHMYCLDHYKSSEIDTKQEFSELVASMWLPNYEGIKDYRFYPLAGEAHSCSNYSDYKVRDWNMENGYWEGPRFALFGGQTGPCYGAGNTLEDGALVLSLMDVTEELDGDCWWELEALRVPSNEPPDCSGASIADQICGDDCTVQIDGGDVTGVTDPDEGDVPTITVSPTTLELGDNSVIVHAEDGSGDICEKEVLVNVSDQTPPQIVCPPAISVDNDPGECSASVSYEVPKATDNCSITVFLGPDLGPGADFPVGTTTETYLVKDIAGLTDTCSFTVTVDDTEPPEISCPADIEKEPAGPEGTIVTYLEPVASDNCSGELTARTGGLGSGSTFPIGTTTETYTVTDGAGSSESCSFAVKVLSSKEVADKLIEQVEELIAGGSIKQGQGSGLTSKLKGIIDKLESAPPLEPSCNQLNAFINHIDGYVKAGKLTAEQGEGLTASAINAGKGAGCE
jgi:hypothetical protein